MELQGTRDLHVTHQQAWDALMDPAVLQRCIPGCESMVATDPTHFDAVLALRIGPVAAKFKGKMELRDIVPPESATISFDGQGGVAGFGKGSADVNLADEGGQTRLKYLAKAQVGGKMAQVGSRLIDAAAGKVAEDFFKAFEAHLAPPAEATVDTGQVPMPADEEKGNKALWWGIGVLVVLLLVYLLSR